MQSQEDFVSSPATRVGHTCLGTLLGTVGAFFAGAVQKTEGKRAKATVFLTVASSERPARRATCTMPANASEVHTDGAARAERMAGEHCGGPIARPVSRTNRRRSRTLAGTRMARCATIQRASLRQACVCTLFPVNADPRIAAGGPITRDILKCQLNPVPAGDYTVRFTTAEITRVFPEGVCDWSKPGVSHQPIVATWLRFSPVAAPGTGWLIRASAMTDLK